MNDQKTTKRPDRPKRPDRALVIAGAVALVVLALTAAAYVLLVVVPAKTVETGEAAGRGVVDVAAHGARTALELGADLAERIRDELGLRPRLRVDSQVVAEQSTEILELATVERTYRVDYVFAHTWLGSTKQIRLTGKYLAKAGFDLERGFELDLQTRDDESTAIEVRLGKPELLSLELLDVGVDEEEGVWNRISDEDRERALSGLRRVARRDVLRTGILNEAQDAMAARVRKIFLDSFAPTEFRFEPVMSPEIPTPEIPSEAPPPGA